jgi:hypothetical protein
MEVPSPYACHRTNTQQLTQARRVRWRRCW